MNEGLPSPSNSNRSPEVREKYKKEWEALCAAMLNLSDDLKGIAEEARNSSGDDLEEAKNIVRFMTIRDGIKNELEKLTPRTNGGVLDTSSLKDGWR
jgi:hypothetical protein